MSPFPRGPAAVGGVAIVVGNAAGVLQAGPADLDAVIVGVSGLHRVGRIPIRCVPSATAEIGVIVSAVRTPMPGLALYMAGQGGLLGRSAGRSQSVEHGDEFAGFVGVIPGFKWRPRCMYGLARASTPLLCHGPNPWAVGDLARVVGDADSATISRAQPDTSRLRLTARCTPVDEDQRAAQRDSAHH